MTDPAPEEPTEQAAPNTTQLARRLVFAVVVLALMLIGTVVYTRVATDRANTRTSHTATDSKHIAECVNSLLGARGPLTAKDNAAQTDFLIAFRDDAKAFQVLLTDLLTSAPSSKSTPDFLAYIKTHAHLVAVSAASSSTLTDDQMTRNATPLGKC